jgi:hypothetical protein
MPEDFRTRIDRTIQKVRDFAAKYPKGHAVVELVPPEQAKAVVGGLESEGWVPHIVSANERAFGRWLPPKEAEPEDPEDDFSALVPLLHRTLREPHVARRQQGSVQRPDRVLRSRQHQWKRLRRVAGRARLRLGGLHRGLERQP